MKEFLIFIVHRHSNFLKLLYIDSPKNTNDFGFNLEPKSNLLLFVIMNSPQPADNGDAGNE